MVDMTNLLSRPAAGVEPPKQLPVGQYLFRVTSVNTKDQQGNPLTTQNGNAKVEFMVQAEAPIEVDPSSLEGVNCPAKSRLVFVVTENSLYRLVAFLGDHLKLPKEEHAVSQMIDMAPGNIFRGTIVHVPSTQPGNNSMYANISETFPA